MCDKLHYNSILINKLVAKMCLIQDLNMDDCQLIIQGLNYKLIELNNAISPRRRLTALRHNSPVVAERRRDVLRTSA